MCFDRRTNELAMCVLSRRAGAQIGRCAVDSRDASARLDAKGSNLLLRLSVFFFKTICVCSRFNSMANLRNMLVSLATTTTVNNNNHRMLLLLPLMLMLNRQPLLQQQRRRRRMLLNLLLLLLSFSMLKNQSCLRNMNSSASFVIVVTSSIDGKTPTTIEFWFLILFYFFKKTNSNQRLPRRRVEQLNNATVHAFVLKMERSQGAGWERRVDDW